MWTKEKENVKGWWKIPYSNLIVTFISLNLWSKTPLFGIVDWNRSLGRWSILAVLSWGYRLLEYNTEHFTLSYSDYSNLDLFFLISISKLHLLSYQPVTDDKYCCLNIIILMSFDNASSAVNSLHPNSVLQSCYCNI